MDDEMQYNDHEEDVRELWENLITTLKPAFDNTGTKGVLSVQS